MLNRILAVLWPAFLVAGVAEGIFFSLFDPHELTFFGEPLEASRLAVYSVGFLCFWAMGAAASAVTMFLSPKGSE